MGLKTWSTSTAWPWSQTMVRTWILWRCTCYGNSRALTLTARQVRGGPPCDRCGASTAARPAMIANGEMTEFAMIHVLQDMEYSYARTSPRLSAALASRSTGSSARSAIVATFSGHGTSSTSPSPARPAMGQRCGRSSRRCRKWWWRCLAGGASARNWWSLFCRGPVGVGVAEFALDGHGGEQ